MGRCPSCGRDNADDARFCSGCGIRVELGRLRDLRRIVTVVFVDLVGSTALGERLDPEAWRRIQSRYFDVLRQAIERHEGTVEKFIGDGVMAVFGIPQAHEDDALRAVRASVEIRSALAAEDFGVRLAVRTGVNTGEVVAGGGDASVIGDAVNVAARLEQLAGSNEVLLGGLTYRLVRDAVRAEPIEPLDLKGKAEPVVAWRLLEVFPGAPALARRFETPLLGRGREVGFLCQAFERVVEERVPHLFTVLGWAGIGKTRLVREVAEMVRGRATVLVGRCLSYGEGITFLPLAELVREAVGDDVRAGLAAALAGEEDGDLVAARVGEAVGVVDGVGGPETFWAVRRLLETLAGESPLICVFEDIHWAEPRLLDLIEYVAESARDRSILLVCLARPELLEERPTWGGGKLNATSILLEPLSPDAVEAMIAHLIEATDLPQALIARIAEAARGTPLFVEQMVAMLIDDGVLEWQDGRWTTSDVATVAVPPAVQALLAARLDRLLHEDRLLLERGAVAGELFYLGAVSALSPELTPQETSARLRGLERRELIRAERSELPGQEAYSFRHALIRDAAYESVAKQERARLHEAYAEWLERGINGRRAEQEEIIGYHLEQASRLQAEIDSAEKAHALARRAGELLASAGRRAFRRGDTSASLLERAAALLPTNDPRRAEALTDLGYLLFMNGAVEQADRVLAESAALARAVEAPWLEQRSIVDLARVRMYANPDRIDLASIEQDTEHAIAVLEQHGDQVGLARSWYLLSELWYMRGQALNSEDAATRSWSYARRTGSETEQAESAGNAIWALAAGPTHIDTAMRSLSEILPTADERSYARTSYRLHGAWIEAMAGNFADARQHAKEGRERFSELGLRYASGWGTLVSGYVEMLAGEPAEAERFMREAYEICRSTGDRWFLSTVLVDLPHPVYAQGNYDAALALVEQINEVPAPADMEWQIKRRTAQAKVLARRGRVDEAEFLAREAVDLAAQTDFVSFAGDAWCDLAEVLRVAERTDEATAAVRHALQLYEDKGNVAAAASARHLIAELAG